MYLVLQSAFLALRLISVLSPFFSVLLHCFRQFQNDASVVLFWFKIRRTLSVNTAV
jgi:hypothetical protein